MIGCRLLSSYAAEITLSLTDAIALYAELALALAGFAGVASAFAGRERRFRPVERLRLVGVVSLSASTFAGCLGHTVATIAGLTEHYASSIAALANLALLAPLVIRALPELWRRAKDADAQVDNYSLLLVNSLFLCEIVLLAYTLSGFGGGWQLVLAFSLQLLHGLWLFYLLLTREN